MGAKPGEPLIIQPTGPIRAAIEAPPSKSLTIRALAAAALAGGRSIIRRPLACDDTDRMAAGIDALGFAVSRSPGTIEVEGLGGIVPAAGVDLDLGDAGTPMRLLTAICCLGRGRFVLDGSDRMRRRPMGDLIRALASLGIGIRSVRGDGSPPIAVEAAGFPGGPVRLEGSVSSQFLSALLMIGPCGTSDLEIDLEGDPVSRPYVDLTIGMMRRFGARVEKEGSRFRVAAGRPYEKSDIFIEGDASSASYWFAAAAVTGGIVRVTGIPSGSEQGDLRFLEALESMGCDVRRGEDDAEVRGGPLTGIDADLGDMPDVAPTLASAALFAEGPTTVRGVAHLRHKESDRIEGIAACARALGARVETRNDGFVIHPPAGGVRGGDVDPRGDHRLAMAFAIAGLRAEGVRILDPGCVSKSYPDFFDRLRDLIGSR